MHTVIQLLKNVAKSHGERVYLTAKTDGGWSEVSFSRADELSDMIAAWWLKQGLARGDRVGLLAEGRPEWVIGELAMLKAGLVSVPMSIKLIKSRFW